MEVLGHHVCCLPGPGPRSRPAFLPNTQQMLSAAQPQAAGVPKCHHFLLDGSVTGMSCPLRHFSVLPPPPHFLMCSFACLVYKSKTLRGRYFSDCLFVLAETSAVFSRALTYDSLAAFFCLKHCIFLSDSEHFGTWTWKSTYCFITNVFMLLVLLSCNSCIMKSQSKNLS